MATSAASSDTDALLSEYRETFAEQACQLRLPARETFERYDGDLRRMREEHTGDFAELRATVRDFTGVARWVLKKRTDN